MVSGDGVIELEEGLDLVELLPRGPYQLVAVRDEYLNKCSKEG